MTTLRDGGSRLAHDRAGHGSPLVLLHPLGADRSVWSPVRARLETERDVLAVDLPGFGDSPALDEPEPTPNRLAEAVAGLLAELGIDGAAVHVGGNSLGGWVALELAARGLVASVTAIAPAGLWARPLAPKPEIARRLARFVAPAAGAAMRSAGLRRLALAGSVHDPDAVPPRDAAALVRAYATAPGFSEVNRAMRANVFAGWRAIEVPVTLAWPEHDRLVARPATLPGGVREVLLPGCGHMPMWDDPEGVATVLLAGSAGR